MGDQEPPLLFSAKVLYRVFRASEPDHFVDEPDIACLVRIDTTDPYETKGEIENLHKAL